MKNNTRNIIGNFAMQVNLNYATSLASLFTSVLTLCAILYGTVSINVAMEDIHRKFLQGSKSPDGSSEIMNSLSVANDKLDKLTSSLEENKVTAFRFCYPERKALEISYNESNPDTVTTSISDLRATNELKIPQIDYDILNKILNDTEAEDPLDRAKALKLLALVGTWEQKYALTELISDNNEDIDLRRNLVLNMDWSENSRNLSELLLNENQAGIRDSIILAALNANWEDFERAEFDNALLKIFSPNNDENLNMQIIDYFANTTPELNNVLLNQWDNKLFSPSVLQRILFVQSSILNNQD